MENNQNEYPYNSYNGQNPFVQPGNNDYQQTQQSAYGSQNAYGQQQNYQQTQNQYAYREAMRQTPPKPEKKSGGFGKTLARTAAIAVVFGLVAGGIFTGVSYAGTKALGVSGTAVSTNEQEKVADMQVEHTSTGKAKELTDVSSIVEETMPSIVAITNTGTVTYRSFFGTQEYESSSCGSGIIIDKDETYIYIATNNHVVSGANSISVQFVNDVSVEGEVQGTYASGDLAVVKVKLDDVDADTLSAIKLITLGDSDTLSVGEPTIAIGNALGYGQSVTTGIVSALDRSITVQDETTGGTVTNNHLIQTDAAINPGNSGGALLNENGELIGINSAKYSDTSVEGIGYAIPITEAMEVIQKLQAGESAEKTQTAYLGIQGKDVESDVASVYGLPEGIYVVNVIEDTGAEEAGLCTGDIITAIDGTKVNAMEEMKKLLCDYNEGDTVTVTFYRMDNGYQKMELPVVLGGESSVTASTGNDSSDNNASGESDIPNDAEENPNNRYPGNDGYEQYDPFEYFGDFWD